MNIREITEKIEKDTLCGCAQLACLSRGRIRKELLCNIRTEYQRDSDRIIHSKAFRRLKHKTQVFIAPIGDHFRTRLTHTIEVSRISRTVARALRFNEDLVEAISLGHDLGHTPFGHIGESALNKIYPGGFVHSQQSVRILEKLEKSGKGLNLTRETLDGILNHSHRGSPLTVEGLIVQICDRVAYINHDIDDAIRAQKINLEKIPKNFKKIGNNSSERINNIVNSILESSSGNNVSMSPEIQNDFNEIFDFMYKNVYLVNGNEGEEFKVLFVIKSLYDYFRKNLNKIPKELQNIAEKESEERAVCDYIAGMTDYFAINIFNGIFVPKSFSFYHNNEVLK